MPIDLAHRVPPALVRFMEPGASLASAHAGGVLVPNYVVVVEEPELEWEDRAVLIHKGETPITLELSPPERFIPTLFPGEFELDDEDDEE